MKDEDHSIVINLYNPDSWVIIRFFKGGQPFYKVLAGWSSSYLYGSSWKLNSGITSWSRDDNGYYYFKGYSGSIYKCSVHSEEVRLSMTGMYDKLTQNENVSQISLEDFIKEFKEK